MQKVVLDNGLTVIFERKRGKSVVVQVMINVGSNHEAEKERGISHFLEHILFEGTGKRPTNRAISNEIEKIGGDFNAYTSNEKTCFYVKVLKKHFHIAVEILADILQNSLFNEDHISKEKNIVLKEIDIIHDEPKYYQWLLFQKNLFKEHPCKNPTYGSRNIIKNLSKTKILEFFQKYYTPNNIVISIVGDVNNWKKEIESQFCMQKGPLLKHKKVTEPAATKCTVKKEKRNIVNTYTVLGFKTVPRSHKDAYVLEVINGILGRGQSGRMFTEIRSKRGLAYDVGTQSVCDVSFGYFAIYATIDKKNLNLLQELILQEMEKLKKVSAKDLKEAKDFIEGDYLLELEDSQKVADQLLFWEQVGDAHLMNSFVRNIKKVTVSDVRKVAEKYFNNYTMVVLEGK